MIVFQLRYFFFYIYSFKFIFCFIYRKVRKIWAGNLIPISEINLNLNAVLAVSRFLIDFRVFACLLFSTAAVCFLLCLVVAVPMRTTLLDGWLVGWLAGRSCGGWLGGWVVAALAGRHLGSTLSWGGGVCGSHNGYCETFALLWQTNDNDNASDAEDEDEDERLGGWMGEYGWMGCCPSGWLLADRQTGKRAGGRSSVQAVGSAAFTLNECNPRQRSRRASRWARWIAKWATVRPRDRLTGEHGLKCVPL